MGSTIGISHRFSIPILQWYVTILTYIGIFVSRLLFSALFFFFLAYYIGFMFQLSNTRKGTFLFWFTFFTSPYYSVFSFSPGDSFLLAIWPPSLFVYRRGFNDQVSSNFLLLKPLLGKVEYNNGFERSEYYICANLAIHQDIKTRLPWGKHAYHRPSVRTTRLPIW